MYSFGKEIKNYIINTFFKIGTITKTYDLFGKSVDLKPNIKTWR